MATIGQVADALATTISLATGTKAIDHVPANLDPPAIFVVLEQVEVTAFGRGTVEMRFNVVVFVSKTVDRVGQHKLYEYLSPSGARSIVKAVYDTPTLGLSEVNASAVSEPARALGVEEIAAYGYFGGLVPVLVVTQGA